LAGREEPRVRVDQSLAPSSSLSNTDNGYATLFWYDPSTLALRYVKDIDVPPTAVASARASHWQPASRTSGVHWDQYSLLDDRATLAIKYADEDGHYITFARYDSTTPVTRAMAVHDAVRRWQLFGAENYLLAGHFLGFSKGAIELLRAEEGGYYVLDGDWCEMALRDPTTLRIEYKHMAAYRFREPMPQME